MPLRQHLISPADRLLNWYDRHRRVLPWRALPEEGADPYRVWLSEIMLQQTTVAAVIPYFQAFTSRWPTVHDLANAPLEDVLSAWAGLGYYARARNLHACARVVSRELSGCFPDTEVELRKLPGIGAYTAAAITAIAFGKKATAIDGNVERVISRVFQIETPLPASRPEIRMHAEALTPDQRTGDYTQAIMDLGATICTPRSPKCMLCPWQGDCAAFAAGVQESLPRKAAKAERPIRRGMAFWLTDSNGHVLLRRRPEKGLLGGMLEVPSTSWESAASSLEAWLRQAPTLARWHVLPGKVQHVFTHFPLELTVTAATLPAGAARPEGIWVSPDDLAEQGLPTVMRKVVRHVQANLNAEHASGKTRKRP